MSYTVKSIFSIIFFKINFQSYVHLLIVEKAVNSILIDWLYKSLTWVVIVWCSYNSSVNIVSCKVSWSLKLVTGSHIYQQQRGIVSYKITNGGGRGVVFIKYILVQLGIGYGQSIWHLFSIMITSAKKARHFNLDSHYEREKIILDS